MTNWAAIVYGRTYEVDFRLLALPGDFTRSEQDWLIAHIQTMTRYAEDLPNKPRWAVFRQDALCVVVVACMARDLMEQTQVEGLDLTHDQRGRPLYTVVGYATRLSPREPIQIPAYLDRDLRGFSPIYQQYVTPHWQVKSYVQDEPTTTEYQLSYSDPEIVLSGVDQSYFSLNLTQTNVTVLWPDAINYRQALWVLAGQQLTLGRNVSLCLSLPTRSSAVNGAFLNGTAFDVTQKEEIIRAPQEPPTSSPLANSDQPLLNPPSTVARRQVWIIALALLGGALVGGATGLWASKFLDLDAQRDKLDAQQDKFTTEKAPSGIPNRETDDRASETAKTAIYIGVGAIAGSLLSLLVGILLARRIARSTSSSTRVSSEPAGTEDELSKISTRPDPMVGFREKNKQSQGKDDDFMTWR